MPANNVTVALIGAGGAILGAAIAFTSSWWSAAAANRRARQERTRAASTAFIEATLQFAAWTEPGRPDDTRHAHVARLEGQMQEKLLRLQSTAAPVMIGKSAQARKLATDVVDAAGELLPVILREVAGPGGDMPEAGQAALRRYIAARDAFTAQARDDLGRS
jgi:type II secretory pathway pseudopilin PulG